MIFCLAKILRPEKLRQANNLCALSCGIANKFNRASEILLRLHAAAHLDEGDFCHSERSRGIPLHSLERIFAVCLDFARHDRRINYFTESAGTILMLSITTRLVGLLGSPMLFLVTGISPIFPSTSWPLISLPKVVY